MKLGTGIVAAGMGLALAGGIFWFMSSLNPAPAFAGVQSNAANLLDVRHPVTADMLKDALIRENYSDVLAIVKESQRPARLFGVLTISNDGKWADHMITVLLFSVVGIVMTLLDDD